MGLLFCIQSSKGPHFVMDICKEFSYNNEIRDGAVAEKKLHWEGNPNVWEREWEGNSSGIRRNRMQYEYMEAMAEEI